MPLGAIAASSAAGAAGAAGHVRDNYMPSTPAIDYPLHDQSWKAIVDAWEKDLNLFVSNQLVPAKPTQDLKNNNIPIVTENAYYRYLANKANNDENKWFLESGQTGQASQIGQAQQELFNFLPEDPKCPGFIDITVLKALATTFTPL